MKTHFPLRRLTARSVIKKRTVAATRGDGREASFPAVRGATIKPRESARGGHLATAHPHDAKQAIGSPFSQVVPRSLSECWDHRPRRVDIYRRPQERQIYPGVAILGEPLSAVRHRADQTYCIEHPIAQRRVVGSRHV